MKIRLAKKIMACDFRKVVRRDLPWDKELKELDILKDKNSKDIEVTHILFIDYRKDNKIYAIDINLFSALLSTEKKVIQRIFNIGDFFIPRSLWWKLFKELYSSKS